jgi:hypothetical protein
MTSLPHDAVATFFAAFKLELLQLAVGTDSATLPKAKPPGTRFDPHVSRTITLSVFVKPYPSMPSMLHVCPATQV